MSVLQIMIYIGLAQGILLGLVLTTTRRGNRAANRILGSILILFSAGLVLHTTCHGAEAVWVGHHKEIVMMLFIFTPVLFYYYVLTLTYGNIRLNWAHLAGPLTGIAVFGSHIFFNIIQEELAVDILGTILFIMIFIYAIFSFRALFRYHQAIRNSFSSLEKINLVWLRNLLIAFLLSWVLTSVVEALKIEPVTGDLIWLIVSVFIYWIGYMGLVQPEIFTGEMKEALPDESAARKKYEKSTLTEEKAAEIGARLRQQMTDHKPYLETDITLPKLAKMLAVTTHELSQVINEKFGQNFFEFINQRRIEESRLLMDDPKNDHLNIAAIGFASGFNSLSAFNSAFKKYSQMTPSQYRSTQKINA